MFFPGFTLHTARVPGGAVRYRIGGAGPALVLLHGSPQTHAMWHAVAPRLAERFTVVCPDLRGYGGSEKPPATPGHEPYAKSAMAQDVADLMTLLGFETFAVAGHDRGARVAYRLALDHGGRVTRLAVLDAMPPIETFDRADMAQALGQYGCWFAEPHPLPEDIVARSRETWFIIHTGGTPGIPAFFHGDALADYFAALDDPAALAGMREAYLAATTVDPAQDRASRAEDRRAACPMLVLWGARGQLGGWYSPLDLWRAHCAGPVTGGPVDSGHFLAEESPDAVLAWFDSFF